MPTSAYFVGPCSGNSAQTIRTSFLVLTIRALRHLWDTLRHSWDTLRHFGTFFLNIETLLRRLEQILYFHICSLWLTSKTIKLQWLRFFHPTDQKEKWSHVEQIWYQSLCSKWLKKIGDTLNNIIYFEKCDSTLKIAQFATFWIWDTWNRNIFPKTFRVSQSLQFSKSLRSDLHNFHIRFENIWVVQRLFSIETPGIIICFHKIFQVSPTS